MIKLTGLWKSKTKDGKEYLSGTIGNASIQIWKNEHKKEDKHPDYNLVIAEIKKKEDKNNTETNQDFDKCPF